jgi:hypothetical protein
MKCFIVGNSNATEQDIENSITFSGFHIEQLLFVRDNAFEYRLLNLTYKYHIPYNTYERMNNPVERLTADREILKECDCMIIVANYLTDRMRKLIKFAKELGVSKYVFKSGWINNGNVISG